MSIDQDNPVISRQVIEMITVAHEYCVFFEKADKYTSDDIQSFFQKVAPLLYLKGSLLPEEVEAEYEYAERYVTEEQWEGMFKTLRAKLDNVDLYYALDENADSAQHSLADNIADIYQDMKDFVMLYQKPPLQSKTVAVAELRRLFETHWGPILLKALVAMHNNLFITNTSSALSDEWEE
jgi:hypothetical protein